MVASLSASSDDRIRKLTSVAGSLVGVAGVSFVCFIAISPSGYCERISRPLKHLLEAVAVVPLDSFHCSDINQTLAYAIRVERLDGHDLRFLRLDLESDRPVVLTESYPSTTGASSGRS